MKVRFLVLFLIVFLGINSCFAKEFYTCSEPFDLSPGIVKYPTNMLGLNFIAKKIAQNIIKKELIGTIQGNIKVKLDSYSVFDLKKGIIKSLKISGDNIVSDEVYITGLTANTLCDFNYVDYQKNPIEYKVPMPMQFTMVLTDSDLNKSFFNENNKVYKKRLNQINIIMNDILITKQISTEIRNNKFYIILNGHLPIMNLPVKVTVSSKINVKNNQIVLNETFTRGLSKFVPNDTMYEIMNILNPLEYTINSFETTRDKIIINNVKIIDNKISIDGIMILGEKK